MEDKCFCHFNGLAVKDAHARKNKVDNLNYVDEIKMTENQEKDNPKPFSEELYNILKSRERVYVEEANNAGVTELYYLSANADKLFNPYGYTDFEEMCASIYVTSSNAVEGEHYVTKVIDGVTSYHGRLYSTVARTLDGQIRVNATPKSSTDATSKQYVDKNSFASTAIKNYEIPIKGSNSLFSLKYDQNKTGSTIVQRTSVGELRGVSTDESASDTLVNKEYMNTKIQVAKNEANAYTDTAISNAVFGTVTSVEHANTADVATNYIDSTGNKVNLNSRITAISSNSSQALSRIEKIEPKIPTIVHSGYASDGSFTTNEDGMYICSCSIASKTDPVNNHELFTYIYNHDSAFLYELGITEFNKMITINSNNMCKLWLNFKNDVLSIGLVIDGDYDGRIAIKRIK